jgi:Rho termination factor, N-terminal domain
LRDTGATVAGQARAAVDRTAGDATAGIKQVAGQARASLDATAGDVTTGTKQVVGQAKAQGERAAGRLDEIADQTARRATDAVDPSPTTGTPYEQWTRADLYARAQELGVDGRSTMSKQQLIKALRAR